MNIESTGPSAPIQFDLRLPQRTHGTPSATACDRVRTSKQAEILSRNLPALQEQLRPRADVLARFQESFDRPVELDAQVLDHILGQL